MEVRTFDNSHTTPMAGNSWTSCTRVTPKVPTATLCLLSAVCYLLSAICCLLRAVCCVLSAVCYLLSAICYLICCLLPTVYCMLSAIPHPSCPTPLSPLLMFASFCSFRSSCVSFFLPPLFSPALTHSLVHSCPSPLLFAFTSLLLPISPLCLF
jgi:hypothetical protein